MAARGFSTIETVVALTVFLVVISAVSATALQLASTLARQELRQEATAAIDRSLAEIATAPFDTLVAEQFTPPESCDGPGASAMTSCVDVNGEDLVLDYTTALGGEVVAGPGTASSSVTVTAATTLPDGTSVTRSRQIPAPAFGLTSDTAVLRVRSIGEQSDMALVLLDAAGSQVGVSAPFRNGLAVFRVAGDACATGPCRLGLTTGATYWTAGGFTLAPPDVLGPGAALTLTPGSFQETSVRVGPVGSARLRLLARSASGTDTLASTPAGTVCLWGSFDDGAARRFAPLCNGADGVASLAGFTDPGTGAYYPFPAGFEVSVTVDPADGVCATTASFATLTGAATGTFAAADPCTSWTWGVPTRFGPQGQSELASFPQTVTVEADSPVYDVVWTTTGTPTQNWSSVAVGGNAACGITTGGALYCWGNAAVAGLGLTSGTKTAPTRVGTDTDWSQVSAGERHACALKTNGALYCWGDNTRGATGLGTFVGTQAAPTRVGTATYASVAAGGAHTCAVKSDATLWCFGANQRRQLGTALTSLGAVTDYSVPAGYAEEITTGSDGNLWYVSSQGKIGRITTDGAITEYITPTANPGLVDITAGPDGNVWFTAADTNRVGYVTPAGLVTEFPLSTPNAGPHDITAGGDGYLWVTLRSVNKIARVSTSGQIVEYATGVGASPEGITTGADGRVWYVTRTGNTIGTITTTGAVTEYPLPTSNAAPADVGRAADGSLWVIEQSGNKVAKVDPVTGAATEYALPTPGAVPTGVAAGADGALWFTQYSASKIASVDATGAITEYPLAAPNTQPDGITLGPDASLWVTTRSGKILKVVPATAVAVQVTSTTSWGKAAAGSDHTCARRSDNSLWCWGSNTQGQTGAAIPVGASIDRVPDVTTVPTRVGVLSVSDLTAGAAHSCAVRTDANQALWCFGANRYGQSSSAGTGIVRDVYTSTSGKNIRDAVSSFDGTLYVAVGNAVVRVDTAGRPQLFTSPQSADLLDLAVGNDGRVWATVAGAAEVLAMTSTGTFSRYPVASPLWQVTGGPDGNIWATADNGTIIELDVSGAVQGQYATASPSPGLRGITAGADGNVWFAATSANKIGKVTPTGTVTEYSSGLSASAGVTHLTVGADGNVWFTETTANKVGKITPTGTITEYSAGISASAGLARLVAADDGTVWFTQAATGKIASITTTGTVREQISSMGALTDPAAIALGPDGSVWVAGGASSRYARVLTATTGQAVADGLTKPSAGLATTCAVGATNALWCVGASAQGQTGQVSATPFVTPVQVTTATDWVSVSLSKSLPSACGVRATNVLGCWGSNIQGITGIGLSAGVTVPPVYLSSTAGQAVAGTPAAGNDLVAPWTKPRSAALSAPATCSSTANSTPCASYANVVPETTACTTDIFCLSSFNAPPRLTSPAYPYAIRPTGVLSANSVNTFSLTFTDPESDALSYRITAAPGVGALSPAPAVWTSATSGSPISFSYTPTGAFSNLDGFTVEVKDATNAAVSYPVIVYKTNVPLVLSAASTLTGTQGQTVSWPVTVYNADGSLASSTSVSLSSSNPTVTASAATVTTNSAGVATFSVSLATATTAPATLTATASGRSVAATLSIAPDPGTVTLGVVTALRQGETTTAQATVTDRANSAMTGQFVSFTVLDPSGQVSNLVRTTTSGCTTVAGICTTTVSASPAARAGTYTLVATAGSQSTTQVFSVTAAASLLRLYSLTDAAGTVVPVLEGRAGANAYASLMSTLAPVLRLGLDETSGTTATATAGSAGTYAGDVDLGRRPLAGPAPTAAVRLDATDTVCASVTRTRPYSISGWVSLDAYPSANAGLLGDAAPSALIGITPDGKVTLTAANQSVTGPTLERGRAYHLAAVLAAGQGDLYVDGALVASVSASAGPLTRLCAGPGLSASAYSVTVDELAVFSGALYDDTVARIAATGKVAAASGAGAVISLTQGETIIVAVQAVSPSEDGTASGSGGFSNDGVVGAPVSVSATAGVSASAITATTGVNGLAGITITAGADADPQVPATVSVSSGTTTLPVTVLIEGRATQLTSRATAGWDTSGATPSVNVAQGGRTVADVLVTDAQNRPVPGTRVSVSPIADGVRVTPTALTDASGVARLWVEADAGASLGAYSVTASAETPDPDSQLTLAFDVVVQSGPGRVVLTTPEPLYSGSTTGTDAQVVVYDKNDTPIDGVSVSLECAYSGLSCPGASVSTSGPTGATFRISDTSGATPAGTYYLVVNADGASYPVALQVRSRADTLTAPAVTVRRGSYTPAIVTVTGPGGAPVPAQPVTASSPALKVIPAISGPSGKATLIIAAAAGLAPGTYQVTLQAGAATTTLSVTVE